MNTRSRLAFLEKQIAAWEGLYRAFLATEGASQPMTNPGDPPQAADFLLVITGLRASYKDSKAQ